MINNTTTMLDQRNAPHTILGDDTHGKVRECRFRLIATRAWRLMTNGLYFIRRLPNLILGLSIAIAAYPQAPALSAGSALNNRLVMSTSDSKVFLVRDGQKYWVLNANWVANHGYNWDSLRRIDRGTLDAIPSGPAITEQFLIPGPVGQASLENRLVFSAEENRVYFIRHGQRHWVLDWRWIGENRHAGREFTSLPKAEVEAIPIGSAITFLSAHEIVVTCLLAIALFAFFFFSAASRRSVRCSLGRRWPIIDKAFQKSTLWNARTILFVGFVAAMILREPLLIRHPRFWAEEGSVWFQYAVSHSVLQTICFVYRFNGYMNLMANIGAVLSSRTAAIFGLEYAPAASTFAALLIQALAIGLILFGRSRLFDSLWKALAGCLIVLFAPTATDEVWLNSTHSMEYLGLIALILLFDKVWLWPRWLRWASWGLLILCGLSGPYAVALFPLFLGSALLFRKRELKIQCVILCLCLLVQGGGLLNQKLIGSGLPGRGSSVLLDASVVNVFFSFVALPSLGATTAMNLLGTVGLTDAWLAASSYPHPASVTLRLAAWFCFLVMSAVLWHLKGSSIYSERTIMFGAFLVLSTVACSGSLNAIPLGRYAFLPGLAFLLRS